MIFHVVMGVIGIACLAGILRLALWVLGFGGKDAT
jgi:hypothetical protein